MIGAVDVDLLIVRVVLVAKHDVNVVLLPYLGDKSTDGIDDAGVILVENKEGFTVLFACLGDSSTDGTDPAMMLAVNREGFKQL